MLITISRQYGAGGSEVARLIALGLGWSVVDNELIDLVAQRAGLSPADVARQDERVPSFAERLIRTLAIPSQEYAVPQEFTAPELAGEPKTSEQNLLRITEAVVKELAAVGRVVLVGRAAPAVIGREIRAIHVKIVASRAVRVRYAEAADRLDARAAEKRVDQLDAQRGRYHRENYGRDWDDPSHYHMILNTGLLGYERAAELVVAYATRLGWAGNPGPG